MSRDEPPAGALRRLLPALGMFAGALAVSVTPHGAFDPYNVVARAALAAIVAGVTTVLLFLAKR